MEMDKIEHHTSKQSKERSLELLRKYHQAEIIGLPAMYEKKSFETFETNEQNKKLVDKIKKAKRSILLTGKTGTGKTHLAISKVKSLPLIPAEPWTIKTTKVKEEHMLNKLKEAYRNGRDYCQYGNNELPSLIADKEQYLDMEAYKYKSVSAKFVSVTGLMIELSESYIKKESKLEKLNGYAQYFDHLVLDDFGAEKLTEATRQNLYYLIDERYKNMKNTIVTTNLTIEQINEFEPRIASRLAEMGDIFHLDYDDYRLKAKR